MKTFFVFILIGIFGISAHCQENNKADFLQLSFTLKEKDICFGDSIEFVAKLTNISKNPIVIDIRRIGSINYFERHISKTEKEPHEEVLFEQGLASHYNPDFLVLQPNKSYTKNLEFVLNDDFFTKNGKYQMEIGYNQILDRKFENTNVWEGTVFSNKIVIFVNKCGKGNYIKSVYPIDKITGAKGGAEAQ